DLVYVGHDRDVLQGIVDGGLVPVGVHGRAAVLGDDHDVALVRAGARGVLDRHVGPGAGLDDGVAPFRLEHGLEPRAFPGAHADFFHDMIAGLGGEALHGGCAPGAAHQRTRVDDALKQGRVDGEAWRAGLDHEPDVDHGNAAHAAFRREAADVLDHVLLLGV